MVIEIAISSKLQKLQGQLSFILTIGSVAMFCLGYVAVTCFRDLHF